MTPWYTPDDLANMLKVAPRTVQRWCQQRRVPHVKIGSRIRFTPTQVEEIAQAYTVVPEERVDVSAPNPRFRPSVTVVPMKRPPAA